MRFAALALPVVLLLASCASGGTATEGAGYVPAVHLPAIDAIPTPAPLSLPPVLRVHAINGSSADSDAMRQRFVADGWPADRVFTIDFADPSWMFPAFPQAVGGLRQIATRVATTDPFVASPDGTRARSASAPTPASSGSPPAARSTSPAAASSRELKARETGSRIA